MGTLHNLELVLLALALGYSVPHVRDRWLPDLGTDLGRDQLIAFLSSVATGMMAFTGVVLSILLVLPQFGTSAYTPRIVGSWVKNRRITNATGIFSGTFVYALMALRGVGVVEGSRSCALTMYVAFVWLMASLWMLARLASIFTELNHANVLRMLRQQGADAIERAYATPLSSGGADATTATAEAPGEGAAQVIVHDGPPLYVVRIDAPRLVSLAQELGVVLRLPFAQGDSLTGGAALALVYGRAVPAKRLLASIELGPERDIGADPKYALRLLVDVGVRALSASVNDPTTAVQALDQIEALLTQLGNLELDVGHVRDARGELRLVYDTTSWEEYLELALAEIQHYGAASVQVERRLAALLAFLRDHVPAPRRAAVDLLAQQHVEAVAEALHGPSRTIGARGDRQGLGHTLQ
jgi:uncharacterized membrane protein